MSVSSTVFALPDRLSRKAAAALVAADERHFDAIAATLDGTSRHLTARLDQVRQQRGGGQDVLERDLEVHRLTARLRTLERYGLDVCLGRAVLADRPDPVYVGRLGLTDADDRPLLVDWRSPAAEPFFAATHADPMGLVSRRRYRWSRGRIVDYWDEVLTADPPGDVALDDESAFIASLGSSRSPRMRDVLATIAADQDAVIRRPAAGALVVDGGPGTGKTVVALHRTAYLLYADPRLGHRRGGVLFVGPHEPYLAYVSDVLPSLGEEGVLTGTVRDLVPESESTHPEPDPDVARLKGASRLVAGIEPAVALYEEPPHDPLLVETPWADLRVEPADWATAFAAPEPGTPHNEAREQVLDALIGLLLDRAELEGTLGDDPDADGDGGYDAYAGDDTDWVDPVAEAAALRARVERSLRQHRALRTALDRSWPTLDPADVVGDLWTVPAYLRRCVPSLTPDEVRVLQRADPQAWTDADLPLLDAARYRLGDAGLAGRRRRAEAAAAAHRARMADVVDHLIATDDSEMHLMSMLRGEDLQGALEAEEAPDPTRTERLAGPFAHVVVDEAQELTDAEWLVLLRRCPSGSLTVVGDRAQARHGFPEPWADRLARIGVDRLDVATLTVNYRTPREVMDAAEPVIRAVLPDANVPTSIRTTGVPVGRGHVADLEDLVAGWLADHDEGVVGVIGAVGRTPGAGSRPRVADRDRVQWLTPELAKGLEFDLVVLVDPEGWGGGTEGAVDRYVAMTRATQRLVVLTG